MNAHLVRNAGYLQSEACPEVQAQECHQIILVVDGEVELRLPAKTILARKGDMVLLSKDEPCRTTVRKAPYKRYFLSVDPVLAEEQLCDEVLLSMLCHHPLEFNHCTRVKDMDNFIRIFGNLISEYRSQYCKPYAEEMQLLLVKQLLVRVYRTQNRTAMLMPDFPMRDRIFTVQYYIDANYKTDLKISRICQDLHINPSHFSRMFKTYIGMSPKQYLTHIRLNSIKKDLLMTSRSITDIAMDNGFMDINNFTRLFRKSFGFTPSQFREQAKKGGES